MADQKVIDIHKGRRVSKENFEKMKREVEVLTFDETLSITMIVTDSENATSVRSYGMNFETLGFSQAVLNTLGQTLLNDHFDRDS